MAAAPRQSQLSTLERVQSARPLWVELNRLGDEVAGIKLALDVGVTARDAGAVKLSTSANEQQAAAQVLILAELAKTQAQPSIDRARELDAAVSALDPGWQVAIKTRDSAQAQLNLDDGRKTEAGKRLAGSKTGLADAQAWLSANEAMRTLAQTWPRWETLFGNARDHLTARDRAAGDIKGLNAAAAAIALAVGQQQAAVVAANAKLSAAQQELASRTRDCADLDPEKLALEKQRTASRGESLHAAAQLRLQIGEALQQSTKFEQQRQAQRQLVLQCDLEQQAGAAQQPLLERDLKAAQQSLELATLAAGKDAKSLRAGLQPDSPCPVCGAVDHPYADHSPQSDAILKALRSQVDEKQRASNALLQGLAAATARSQAAGGQIKTLTGELALLAQADASRRHAWAALALQAELSAVAEADQTTWLADQQVRAKAALERLAVDEKSYRDKLKKKELAQGAMAPAQRAVDDARQGLDKAGVQQQLAAQALAVQHQKLAERGTQLADVLLTLDGAFADISWHDDWLTDPVSFVGSCGKSAKQWLLKHQQVQQLSSQINTQQSELDGCDKACLQAAEHLRHQFDQLVTLGHELQVLREERRKIFDGRATPEVESGLNGSIEQAKTWHLQAQNTLHSAQTDNALLAESVRLATERLATSLQRQASATEQLDGWIAASSAIPGSAPWLPDDLKRLLATPADWLVQEREALQVIARAVASGQAVLEEHRSAKARHEAGKTAQQDAETLRAAQAITVVALAEATRAHTGLRIDIAQDDEKLDKSLALRGHIDQQTARSRVWSQLGELIGSADGKKFRNFAQQLTLDILLRDANLHLQSLSRRYRLERITDSLGLLVIDQDMGDERRSVHSLSGGESFLVSLALALGLASLSSNRVRVESLFIDEGFGSLDADSLRVAMDALDKLQALGRKVGVISHVQEMTERIGTRINVRRMAGGQSKVTVS
jgi:exonuclease SbcC